VPQTRPLVVMWDKHNPTRRPQRDPQLWICGAKPESRNWNQTQIIIINIKAWIPQDRFPSSIFAKILADRPISSWLVSEILARISRGCCEDATRKTAVVEFKLRCFKDDNVSLRMTGNFNSSCNAKTPKLLNKCAPKFSQVISRGCLPFHEIISRSGNFAWLCPAPRELG